MQNSVPQFLFFWKHKKKGGYITTTIPTRPRVLSRTISASSFSFWAVSEYPVSKAMVGTWIIASGSFLLNTLSVFLNIQRECAHSPSQVAILKILEGYVSIFRYEIFTLHTTHPILQPYWTFGVEPGSHFQSKYFSCWIVTEPIVKSPQSVLLHLLCAGTYLKPISGHFHSAEKGLARDQANK